MIRETGGTPAGSSGVTPAPLSSVRFLRAYLVTMRPYLLFISGAAGLVGLSFAPVMPASRIVLAFVPLFLSYGLGQALTDCFQMDTDAISAPYRPLVRGEVRRGHVLLVSLVALTAVVLVLAYLNPRILLLGLAAVVGLATYTWFKRRWWGGPPWNSWIVALLPMMGRLAEPGATVRGLLGWGGCSQTAFTLAVIAVFFGYANFVVMGYFKDISADRATGYRTFPVVFGWRAAAVYGDVVAAASALATWRVLAMTAPLSGLRPVFRGPQSAWALFAAGVILHLIEHVSVHRTRDERATGGAIAHGVRALVLYCLAIATANRPDWLPWLGGFYVLFELVLAARPTESQV